MNASSVLVGALLAGLTASMLLATLSAVRTSRHAAAARRLQPISDTTRRSAGSAGPGPGRGPGPGPGRHRRALVRRPLEYRSLLASLHQRRRNAAFARALPSAVDDIARSLRGGGSVRTALADAAGNAPQPLASELGLIVRATDHGIPLRDSIEHWARSRPGPDVRLTAAALVLGIDTGAGLARTLDGVATTLYERAAIIREARALSTQARYSAGVLAVAPLVFLVVVIALDDSTLGFLLGTRAGLACLAIGLGLDLAGGWWMARIMREAT